MFTVTASPNSIDSLSWIFIDHFSDWLDAHKCIQSLRNETGRRIVCRITNPDGNISWVGSIPA